MGEKINKEQEEFKEYLDKKEQKLKLLVSFDLDNNIDEVLNTTEAISNILYYYIKGENNG